MLLLVGIFSNSIYAIFEFYQEHRYYKIFMAQQASQLSSTLSQILSYDVRYKNYFKLWTSIRKVYMENQTSNRAFNLIIINEIAVVNKKGRVLAHTNPEKHKPGSPYSNPLLKENTLIENPSNIIWLNQKNKLFIFSAISYNNETDGYMLIDFNTKPLNELRDRALKTYIHSQAIILGFIITVTGLFARKIATPINEVISILPGMGSGKINITNLKHRRDEFRTLALSLEKYDKKINETHNAIIEQQQKLSGILNNSDTIIYMKDTNGRYLLANHRYKEILNIHKDEIGGKTDYDIHPDNFARQSCENDKKTLLEKTALHFEENITLEDGEHTYITVKFPVTDAQGNIYAIGSISTDITERKRIEKELILYKTHLESIVEERTRELKESINELEAFSYSVSHDLRTPLRSINGFSLALREDYQDKLDETGNDFLERIIRATDRMGNIIDDLLLLSRVNRHEINAENISLSQIAEKIIHQLQDSHPDQTFKVNIENNIRAHADPKLIYLAMENLLGNAWKYTANSKKPEITFGKIRKGGENIYFIKDNGTGFNMKYADKLFQAFQRLHGSEYEGTGIGLATVYRIIQRHKGRIWAESREGHGSTFYFSLQTQTIHT